MDVIPAQPSKVTNVEDIVRVAAYCRVSTNEESQATSYEIQIQYYTDYVSRKPNWRLVGIYADEGISGTSVKKRKQFLQMIQDCEEGKIDLIIIKDVSRFSRNSGDISHYIGKLKNLNPPIPIYFENDRIDTLDPRYDAYVHMMGVVAQAESQRKSESIKWSIRHRFANNNPLCPTSSLLGYEKDAYGNVIIYEAEAAVVRFIYRSFLEGLSTGHIAQLLTEAKIPTALGNEVWPSSSVRSILKNERYCGDVLTQKTVTLDYLTHKVVKNKGLETQHHYHGRHPAIIDPKTWELVQGLLQVRRCYRGKAIVRDPTKIRFSKKRNLKGFFFIYPGWNRAEVGQIFHQLESKKIKELQNND